MTITIELTKTKDWRSTIPLTFVLFLLLLTFLSGCGMDQKVSTDTVTLVFFGEARRWEPITDRFMKETPGVEIKLLGFPGEGYITKINTMYAGGTPPDVLWTNEKAAEFVSRGLILDLTPYVERDKEEMDLLDIYPQLLENCKYKGKYYWFPTNFNADVIFYNKKLFDEDGLPYPDEDLTYDQFLTLAKKLTKDIDGDGKIDQYGAYIFWVPDWILGHVLKFGGEIFNPDMSKCLIDKPENIAAIQWYIDLIKKHKVVPTTVTLSAQSDIDMFMTGKIAMFNCAWYVSGLFKNIKGFEWDVAPVPKRPGELRITYGGINMFMISKKVKNPESAWKLVKYLNSVAGQKYFLEGGFDMPIRKSVAALIPTLVNYPEHRKVFADAMQYARLIPEFPRKTEVMDVLKQEFDDIYYKDAPVTETCKRITERVNRLLNNTDYLVPAKSLHN